MFVRNYLKYQEDQSSPALGTKQIRNALCLKQIQRTLLEHYLNFWRVSLAMIIVSSNYY